MTRPIPRALQVALSAWAAVSFILALLPAGTGGLARSLNAVLFLTMGPACALAALLARKVPATVAVVIGLAGSLTLLILSSQVLLSAGLWAPWRVAALVSATTIALVVVPIRTWDGSHP